MYTIYMFLVCLFPSILGRSLVWVWAETNESLTRIGLLLGHLEVSTNIGCDTFHIRIFSSGKLYQLLRQSFLQKSIVCLQLSKKRTQAEVRIEGSIIGYSRSNRFYSNVDFMGRCTMIDGIKV